MNELLIKQLMEDYSFSYEEITDDKNHFSIYKVNDNRRKYDYIEECPLKMAIINNKLLFSGKEEIIKDLEPLFKDEEGWWMLEPDNLQELEKVLHKHKCEISMVHPYFISDKKEESISTPYEITKYIEKELEIFKEDDRWDEAFDFNPNRPDVIAYSLKDKGRIIGIVAASIDSPFIMQIGVNVIKGYEGKHVASALVSIIRNYIVDMGYLAYYETSFSHIASIRVALNAGFKLGWIELFTMPTM